MVPRFKLHNFDYKYNNKITFENLKLLEGNLNSIEHPQKSILVCGHVLYDKLKQLNII